MVVINIASRYNWIVFEVVVDSCSVLKEYIIKMSDVIQAAKHGDLQKVKYYLEGCGSNVNAVSGEERYFPLYWASCNGHLEVVLYLIYYAGATVNQKVRWGSTSLHAAAERGHIECVHVLCKANADINCQNNSNLDTPLHLAAYRGHVDVCKCLILNGANWTLHNREGKTCLDEAYEQKKTNLYLSLHKFIKEIRVKGPRHNDFPVIPSKYEDLIRSSARKFNPSFPQHEEQHYPQFARGKEIDYLQKHRVPIEQSVTDQQEKIQKVFDREVNYDKEIKNDKIEYSKASNQRTVDNNEKEKHNIFIGGNETDLFTANHKCHVCNLHITSENKNIETRNCNCGLLKQMEVKHPYNYCTGEIPPENALPHAQSTTPLHDYIKTIESLQIQISNERDHVAFLEKKNLELYKECETQRSTILHQKAKINLNKNYKHKYEHLLQETELLKTRLKESDFRARSLARLACNSYSISNKVVQSSDKSSPVTINTTMDGDAKEVCSTKTKGKNTSTSSSSSEGSSLDSFTKNIISSTAKHESELSHGELYKAILPVFCYMGATFQRTIGNSLTKSLEKTLFLPSFPILDKPGQEWVFGEHYILEDHNPVNRQSGKVEGCASLVFRIKLCQQDPAVYILKMMINLVDLAHIKHGEGQSCHLYLYQQFSPEHDIPGLLHPNIVPVCHYYNGSTLAFENYTVLCFPPELQDISNPVEMANETTFIVMPEYPTTLAELFKASYRVTSEEGIECGSVPETFVIQKLFEILAAVCHLQDNAIAHRDLKADNIFLDHDLRAIVGDFGFSRRLKTIEGDPIPFIERTQAIAGNSGAWSTELATYNKTGADALNRKMTLDEIYHTTDSYAVGNMFFKLLSKKDEDSFMFPSNYTSAFKNVICLLKHHDVHFRLPAKQALIIVGLLLYGPSDDEVSNEQECYVWHHARKMKLLVQKPVKPRKIDSNSYSVLSINSSVKQNADLLERYFFIHITAEEIWQNLPLLKSYEIDAV